MQTAENDVLSGPVLDVLPVLMEQGRFDEVLAAVRELVKRNEALERQFAALRRNKKRPNEGVSSDQLLLFFEQLQEQQAEGEDAAQTDPEAEGANETLADWSKAAVASKEEKKLALAARPKRRPLKKALPEQLPRREQVIEVPKAQRACPSCKQERASIGYDVSRCWSSSRRSCTCARTGARSWRASAASVT